MQSTYVRLGNRPVGSSSGEACPCEVVDAGRVTPARAVLCRLWLGVGLCPFTPAPSPSTLWQPARGPPAAAAGLRGDPGGAMPRQPGLPGAAPALPAAVPQGGERPHRR